MEFQKDLRLDFKKVGSPVEDSEVAVNTLMEGDKV